MLEAATVSQLNVQLNSAATIVGRGACGDAGGHVSSRMLGFQVEG